MTGVMAAAARLARGHHEGGDTMVEVIVAVALLATLSVATVGVIVSARGATASNAERVAAAGLAEREVSFAKQRIMGSPSGAADLVAEVERAGGALTNPHPLAAGGAAGRPYRLGAVDYTVRVEATEKPVAQDTACDQADLAGGKTLVADTLVTVSVTWPNMGPARPETISELFAPRRGAVGGPGTDESYITVRVHGSGAGGGEPRAGLAVTATGGGLRTEATTGSLGCAILMVTPGSGTEYTVRVSGQKDGFPYLTQRGLDQAVSVVTVAGPGGANAADLQIDGFDPAGRLSIIVAGATAATNAVLVVSDDAGGPEPMSLPVNGGGQLAPVYLPPGRYELEVNGTNWQTPVQVTSGEQQSVVLDASAVTGG